jgi:capsular exopolysaccharide synthesis family protein
VGRIDDALRRAARTNGHEPAASTSTAGDDVFSAAWDVSILAPEEPAPAPQLTTGRVVPEPTQHIAELEAGFNSAWADRLVVSRNVNTQLAEQFRRLAATLHQTQMDDNIRTVMVTSASPNDGKTLTAINLALILSGSYRRRVLLVDADLRRPSIRDAAHLPAGTVGLSDMLRAPSDEKVSLLRLTGLLALLPAGRPDPDPMSGLTSDRMRRILAEASERFDWVIIDAPPVGPLVDAQLLAAMVDAALFVVRAGRTPYELVHNAVNALGRERILGVVLNAAEAEEGDDYERYTLQRHEAET